MAVIGKIIAVVFLVAILLYVVAAVFAALIISGNDEE